MLGYSFRPRNARFLARGLGGQRIEIPVMTPNVPSDPMNNCLRSYPIVTFVSRGLDRYYPSSVHSVLRGLSRQEERLAVRAPFHADFHIARVEDHQH